MSDETYLEGNISFCGGTVQNERHVWYLGHLGHFIPQSWSSYYANQMNCFYRYI